MSPTAQLDDRRRPRRETSRDTPRKLAWPWQRATTTMKSAAKRKRKTSTSQSLRRRSKSVEPKKCCCCWSSNHRLLRSWASISNNCNYKKKKKIFPGVASFCTPFLLIKRKSLSFYFFFEPRNFAKKTNRRENNLSFGNRSGNGVLSLFFCQRDGSSSVLEVELLRARFGLPMSVSVAH